MLGQATDVEEARLWEMEFPEVGDRKIRAYGSIYHTSDI